MTDLRDDKEAVLSSNQAFYDAFSKTDIGSMNSLWWQGSWKSNYAIVTLWVN